MINSQFKTIGFFKEHGESSILSEYISNHMNFDSSTLNEVEREKIINYLDKGTMVFSTPLALFDADTYIAPHMFLSDGEWIWTSYFAYYLKKLSFSHMTNEFLSHIRIRKYEISPLSKEQRIKIEIFLGLNILNLGEKVRKNIRRNAVSLGYDVSEK